MHDLFLSCENHLTQAVMTCSWYPDLAVTCLAKGRPIVQAIPLTKVFGRAGQRILLEKLQFLPSISSTKKAPNNQASWTHQCLNEGINSLQLTNLGTHCVCPLTGCKPWFCIAGMYGQNTSKNKNCTSTSSWGSFLSHACRVWKAFCFLLWLCWLHICMRCLRSVKLKLVSSRSSHASHGFPHPSLCSL